MVKRVRGPEDDHTASAGYMFGKGACIALSLIIAFLMLCIVAEVIL